MLGLIAGGGRLPVEIVARRRAAKLPTFVVRLSGMAGPELAGESGVELGITKLGRITEALKGAGCDSVCFAGLVTRPDFGSLVPDVKDLPLAPGVISAARRGDDALLRHLLTHFEKAGLRAVGAHEAAGGMTLPVGPMGRLDISGEARADAEKALRVARAIGELDIGQGAVVARGLVLAVEAQEGTDAMLARVATLPESVRGVSQTRLGVLAKAAKPIQDLNADMPTIGVATVHAAATAGLAGIVAEAGRTLLIDREAVASAADRLGMFVVGV